MKRLPIQMSHPMRVSRASVKARRGLHIWVSSRTNSTVTDIAVSSVVSDTIEENRIFRRSYTESNSMFQTANSISKWWD